VPVSHDFQYSTPQISLDTMCTGHRAIPWAIPVLLPPPSNSTSPYTDQKRTCTGALKKSRSKYLISMPPRTPLEFHIFISFRHSAPRLCFTRCQHDILCSKSMLIGIGDSNEAHSSISVLKCGKILNPMFCRQVWSMASSVGANCCSKRTKYV
jgi:hypothetical protein